MSDSFQVVVVDDEDAVRRLICQILERAGHTVRGFADADSFFAEFDADKTACIVADLRMPKVDGLQLLRQIRSLDGVIAVVILTGHADVRTAVQLMEDGALTLLEKPFEPAELQAVVERAVEQTKSRRAERDTLSSARRAYDELSEEERRVLEQMLTGLPNKAIVNRLGLSPRTVDRRRSAVLTKMNVGSVSELATLVTKLKLSNS